MSEAANYGDPRVGDVVETGGMRGHVREVKGAQVRVAAGRTDSGVWADVEDVTVVYRPGQQ